MGSIIRNLPEEGWEKGIGPGIVDKKIMGPNDSNFMLMGLAKMDPGVKSPPHRHRYTQIFYFLEGHADKGRDEAPRLHRPEPGAQRGHPTPRPSGHGGGRGPR